MLTRVRDRLVPCIRGNNDPIPWLHSVDRGALDRPAWRGFSSIRLAAKGDPAGAAEDLPDVRLIVVDSGTIGSPDHHGKAVGVVPCDVGRARFRNIQRVFRDELFLYFVAGEKNALPMLHPV